MCTKLAGAERNNMSACVYFCTQYLLVTTEMMSACLYLFVVCLLVTTEILCMHVCIYVYNTSWWGQQWYVGMCVFLCAIPADDDRNNVCMSSCVYFCAQYLLAFMYTIHDMIMCVFLWCRDDMYLCVNNMSHVCISVHNMTIRVFMWPYV